LWKQDDDPNDLFEKRSKMESTLKDVAEMVLFINSITLMKHGEEITCGFAFWLCFDFAESQVAKMENYIIRKLLACEVEIDYIKSIRSRGNIFYYVLFFF